MKLDRYLNLHFRFYMREVRTVVYTQFLESYKSVTIWINGKYIWCLCRFHRPVSKTNSLSFSSFAYCFWEHQMITDLYLIYSELSSFVAAGKLHCKIDKVAGVLETNRPDAKNALYQSTIKQGDFLLNRILKLSRVIDIWDIHSLITTIYYHMKSKTDKVSRNRNCSYTCICYKQETSNI